MSLIAPPMLDFSHLTTPADHGQVLVAPEPGALVAALRANADSLRRANGPMVDTTLAVCRRKTREALIGRDDGFVIVTGHDPAFIHPGVWAKHIVAMRLAAAVEGVAINLVVDSDAPRTTMLSIPTASGQRWVQGSVPFTQLPTGYAYEQIGCQTDDEITEFEQAVRTAMGERYEHSQMPTFFQAFAAATKCHDWVDQVVAGRRAVETGFGVAVDDRRVSRVWYGPLLLDMLVNAERFAACYNNALAWYRREFRVRGQQRPIPDLQVDQERCEVAVWVYRASEARRRLYVSRAGVNLRLFADDTQIGLIALHRVTSSNGLEALSDAVSGWRLRPRALAVTIWARLLLADLFIHGIGGAKYDRIADAIIANYYELTPPEMACVSATLHLDLPQSGTTRESVLARRRALRDLQYNPQRNLPGGPDLDPLIGRRGELVRQAIHLRQTDARNHRTRRKVFDDIRDTNAAMLAARPETLAIRRAELARSLQTFQEDEIVRNREYFFGLYDGSRLEALLDALPTQSDFRV